MASKRWLREQLKAAVSVWMEVCDEIDRLNADLSKERSLSQTAIDERAAVIVERDALKARVAALDEAFTSEVGVHLKLDKENTALRAEAQKLSEARDRDWNTREATHRREMAEMIEGHNRHAEALTKERDALKDKCAEMDAQLKVAYVSTADVADALAARVVELLREDVEWQQGVARAMMATPTGPGTPDTRSACERGHDQALEAWWSRGKEKDEVAGYLGPQVTERDPLYVWSHGPKARDWPHKLTLERYRPRVLHSRDRDTIWFTVEDTTQPGGAPLIRTERETEEICAALGLSRVGPDGEWVNKQVPQIHPGACVEEE